jgi:uncharacterized membrane protein YhaH (DUF805 family)
MDAGTEKSEEYRKWKEGDTRPPGPEKIDQSMSQQTSGGRPAHIMGFADAVTNVVINNYVGFKGRASRSEYWWFLLFAFLISIITITIDILVFGVEIVDEFGLGFVSLIATLAMALPSIALTVRRIHDFGQSGWLFLVTIIPLLGYVALFIFGILEGEDHPNQYGAVPTNTLEQDGNIYTNY